jgi:hypothetical protein
MSSILIENAIPLHLSVTNKQIRDFLHKTYDNNPIVRLIHKIDYHKAEFEQTYSGLLGAFDVIFNLNPSNAPMDAAGIANVKALLKNKGILIILIPVHTSTYNGLDDDLEILKKYNHKTISNLLSNGLDILQTRYLNLPPALDASLDFQIGLTAIVIARNKSDIKHAWLERYGS